jgi:excisionase family DNA binding protein
MATTTAEPRESEVDSPALPLSQRRFLTLADAAAYVSISKRTLYRLIANGTIKPRRPVPGRILLDRLELESVVGSLTATPRKGRGHSL